MHVMRGRARGRPVLYLLLHGPHGEEAVAFGSSAGLVQLQTTQRDPPADRRPGFDAGREHTNAVHARVHCQGRRTSEQLHRQHSGLLPVSNHAPDRQIPSQLAHY